VKQPLLVLSGIPGPGRCSLVRAVWETNGHKVIDLSDGHVDWLLLNGVRPGHLNTSSAGFSETPQDSQFEESARQMCFVNGAAADGRLRTDAAELLTSAIHRKCRRYIARFS